MQLWTNDHQEWYRTVYLVSDHWKELRERKLAKNPKCERCQRAATDVHHVNYRNIFDVELSDLLALCRPCHEEEHRVNGMPVRKRPNFNSTPFSERAVKAIERQRIKDLIKQQALVLQKRSVHNNPQRFSLVQAKIRKLERQLASR